MYENVFFFFFFFLNVHISLTMYIIYLKLCVHTENIVMEGTMLRFFIQLLIFFFFFIKCRKNIPKNNQKVTVFLH